MQRHIIEVTESIEVQCLPDVLRRAGYRTAFFQSALGRFEDRPRLVALLGYEEFAAWEEIRGEPLGYLASDDESMVPMVARWLDSSEGDEPFFATVLTSAAHHPYQLPRRIQERVDREGSSDGTPEERYARLVEGQDELLGGLLGVLQERGLAENTIVVAVGDHGEGFGAHGVRQHDTNFYEEGLRVPFVLAGPRVPRTEITRPASLVDMAPTVLDLVDVRVAPGAAEHLAGRSVYETTDDKRPHWFGCWFEWKCRGFVLGNDKVVYLPEEKRALYFDLSQDPDERKPMPVPERLRPYLDELQRVLSRHTSYRWPMRGAELRGYGQWHCPAGKPCRHPASVEFGREVRDE